MESTVVENLVITDLKGKCPIKLPRAYTKDEIPVDLDQIPTPEIVRHLDHLEEITTAREVQNVKEIITPKSLLQLFELAISEKASSNLPEDLGHSHKDRRFLSKVSNNIMHAEDHYEIPLPFHQSEAKLPNNRQQAFKRALWQRKNMLQSERDRNDYVAAITEMIDKGYAEKVACESLQAKHGIFPIMACIIQKSRRKSKWCLTAVPSLLELC